VGTEQIKDSNHDKNIDRICQEKSGGLEMLYILIGLPGTGKSFVAQLLAKKYKAVVLNADEFRQRLFNIDSSKKDQIFPEEWRDIPYRAIFLAAQFLIGAGINVIIDAALYSNVLVSEARAITRNSKVIQTVCSEEVAKERLKTRMDKSKKYSAGPQVYDHMKLMTAKIINVGHIIDTSEDVELQLREI